MRNKNQFMREIQSRRKGLNPDYIIDMLATYPEVSPSLSLSLPLSLSLSLTARLVLNALSPVVCVHQWMPVQPPQTIV